MSYARSNRVAASRLLLSRAMQPCIERLEDRRLFTAFNADINFQPAKSAVPTNYFADTGELYAAQTNGLSYGWNGPHAAQVTARKLRKPTDGVDDLYDTFATMHAKGRGSLWQIAVPDGSYEIGLTVGDPKGTGVNVVDINGSPFLNGRGTTKSRFVSVQQTITVTDGFITLTVPKGRIAKLDFITIAQVITSTVTTPSANQPFTGTPFSTGQIIPAGQYDLGGQGVAFNTAGSTNPGNDAYRSPDPVGMNTGGSTGNVIADTGNGEWLDYTVTVPTAGAYTLSASVSNSAAGGTFHAEIGGTNLTGTLAVPNTGNATVFSPVMSASFTLAAGTQTLQIFFDQTASNGSAGNFDWFELSPVSTTPANPLIPSTETPFLGTPFTTSENIPFADYDLGGEGVGYHDAAATNLGNDDLRDPDTVGIQAGGNTSGDVVGYTAAGEWLNYTVNVPTAGNYLFIASFANNAAGGQMHVEINGTNVTGTIALPNTGSFTTYQTVTSNSFNVSSGLQLVHVSFDTASSNGALGNFDYFQLVPATSGSPTNGESPYLTAFTTNETIPAAQYDKGGEGVAYHDTTPANLGGDDYRPGDGVDIQTGGATGNVVSYVAAGEWLNYTIDVQTAGSYVLDTSCANAAAGGTFHASVGAQNLTGSLSVSNNGSFNTYSTTTSGAFTLAAGIQVLHISFDTTATNGAVGNFDWFQIVPAPTNVNITPAPLVWTTAHNATEGLAEAKSVGVDGKLYVFGGYYTTTPEYQATTSSEAYDPTTDSWAELAPLPVPTTHMGIATDGTYIYIVGGYTYDPKTTYQTFGTVNSWKYDIATNTWSAFVPLPEPRGAGDMEYLDGQLHFFDGLAPPDKTPETTHWALDLTSSDPQWVLSTPTPFSRNHFSGAVLDGKIYLIGGRLIGDDLANPSDLCLTWDPNNPGVWTPIASLPQIRALGVSAVIDGYIFVAGGTTTSYQPIDTVIMYDPTTNTWSDQTPIPAQRLAPCGGAVGNLLIVTTGLGQNLEATTWVANIGT